MAFIDDMRAEGHAVESTCRVLREQGCPVAARTYRAWRAGRPPAPRTISDAVLTDAILATEGTPEGLYGRRKMTHHLRRAGHQVAFCTVDRLMADLGRNGIRRGKGVRTTVPAKDADRAGGPAQPAVPGPGAQPGLGGRLHLLPHLGRFRLRRLHRRRLRPTHPRLARRHRQADRPGPHPAADRAVGPGPPRPCRGAWPADSSHDAGSQYTAIRFTEHLALEGIAPSIGTVGDAYDNGLMESVIGLFKTECIGTTVFHAGPYKTLADIEYATAGWVDWYNHRRLHGTLGMVPPDEFEQAHYAALNPQEQPV